MSNGNQLRDFTERLGYEQGTTLSEDALPQVLLKFAEQKRVGNITDYLVISSAEFWGDLEMEGYQILVKGGR